MDNRVKMALDKALDRLRAASLDASKGTAYTCGAPWFRNASGVLIGSPDPHVGTLIADTDMSVHDLDEHSEVDDDCNAIFLAEAWNFARMILSSPDLLDRLRASDTGRSEAEAMKAACLVVVREVRKNWRPVLSKSRYQAHEIQRFFGGACGLIDEDISALDPAALNPPTGQGEPETPHPHARGRGYEQGKDSA